MLTDPATSAVSARAQTIMPIFFDDCTAVRKARELFGLAIKMDLSPTGCKAASYAASSLLVFPQTAATKDTSRAICLFNGVVWSERTYHYTYFRDGHVPDENEVIQRLSSEAIYAWTRLTRTKVSKGLGSASNRTSEQRAAARAYAASIIEQMDPEGPKAYTDGSAIGNPGPCGAGVYIVSNNAPDSEIAVALGHGTNNIGELWAIAAAIQALEDSALATPTMQGRSAYIITDSSFAIGCLNLEWTVKNNTIAALVAAIRDMIKAARLICHISWVPGHAGVNG